MAENTKIQWATHSWSPWIGCSKVSAGCAHCYAEADFDTRLHVSKWGPHGTRVKTSNAYWRKPIKWNREASESGERLRVFLSLCDPFEKWSEPIMHKDGQFLLIADEEPDRYLPQPTSDQYERLTNLEKTNLRDGVYRRVFMEDVLRSMFRLIDLTPNLDWILCTKRPENIRRMWEFGGSPMPGMPGGYRSNCWLLTSVENQETADERIPHLLNCRDLCPVLGLSCEPLLGPIDLKRIRTPLDERYDALSGQLWHLGEWVDADEPVLDWLIIGGESGRNARRCDVAWIRSLVSQGRDAGVATFVKQLGSRPIACDGLRWRGLLEPPAPGQEFRCRHPKAGNPSEWPEDLRVREVPTNPAQQPPCVGFLNGA